MTKQEKIQEAYREYWEDAKHWVNENGWVKHSKKQDPESFKLFEEKEWLGYWFYRPESLQGIENNNGWIKIESEDDLPKESGEYWTAIGENPNEVFDNEFVERKYFKWRNIEVTHYQPIQNPQPPIY